MRKPSGLVLSAIVLTVLAAPLSHAADPLKVKTDKGRVQGKMSDDGQVRVFQGIPFAAPPVGDLRWKPPQSVAKWHGVRQATSFGYRCMQPTANADMYFHDPGISEDCLTLNVWAPKASKGDKLPVMVWIYGGGFTTGSTSERRQDGEQFAHHGVILVSMNYRLGIFGFFAHPALTAESPQHASGNYGLMDQAAALQWVRRNIEQFGGDPNNITLFGESAGSFSVSAQMASSLSKDLLAHAIGESGAEFSQTGASPPPLADAEKRGETFAQTVLGKTSLADLRAVPAEDLLHAANTQPRATAVRFNPDVDGYFLPESVPAIYAEGKQAHIPLLAGWNRDEASDRIVRLKEQPTLESYREVAAKTYGPLADEFLNAYPATTDAEAVRSMKDLSGDQFIAASTWEWIEAQVKTGGAPVYRYKFERPSPGDPNHSAANGAFHSDEIEYVFNVLSSRAGADWKPEDFGLAQQMQSYWINFARTGNPNGPGLPEWPAYDAADQWQVMHFDVDSATRPADDRARYEFLRHFAASQQSNLPAPSTPK